MTDEERLHIITETLIIVRDNLFRGMSKSIQKLQAKSINEVLGLDNFIQSPEAKPKWVGLIDEEMESIWNITPPEYQDRFAFARAIEANLKEKNNG